MNFLPPTILQESKQSYKSLPSFGTMSPRKRASRAAKAKVAIKVGVLKSIKQGEKIHRNAVMTEAALCVMRAQSKNDGIVPYRYMRELVAAYHSNGQEWVTKQRIHHALKKALNIQTARGR
jgi:hypothetical protein